MKTSLRALSAGMDFDIDEHKRGCPEEHCSIVIADDLVRIIDRYALTNAQLTEALLTVQLEYLFRLASPAQQEDLVQQVKDVASKLDYIAKNRDKITLVADQSSIMVFETKGDA